ncbi:MAG: hypothetical protein M1814_001778 [Vezdaea aestivalis]|nr:MAG: hypothetical protein M1814_001778 [Vezdaea aestivalis]
MRLLLSLAVLASALLNNVSAHSQARNPLNYLSLIENPHIRTPARKCHALSTFDLTFSLHRKYQRIKLTLEPNHDIFPEDAFVTYLNADGSVKKAEAMNRLDHRVYKGLAWTEDEQGRWTHVGSSRIYIQRDGEEPLFEGSFNIMKDNHHVQLKSSYMRTKHEMDPALEDTSDDYMIVFRDSDIEDPTDSHMDLKRFVGSAPGCSSDKLDFNIQSSHPIFASTVKRDQGAWGAMTGMSLFGKRQIDTTGVPGGGNSAGVNLRSTIGQTNGCPDTRKVALVGIATDCTYTASFNSTESARQNIITQLNSASSIYERTFNISLGLRNLTLSEATCPGAPPASNPYNQACSDTITIQDRLNTFSQWRGQRQDGNAYWTLLTTCNTGSAVGLAWLGQACVQTVINTSGNRAGSGSVSGANVVAKTSLEWQIMAHETGHIFGAVHDCDDSTCGDSNSVAAQQCCPLSSSQCSAKARYIMNPSTGTGITDFSPCSIGNICSALLRNAVKSDCLSANKGVVVITGSQCGNGIVEEGEQCDCGGEQSCGANACCDPKTCKFKTNAVCDDSNEDCCRGCQFASSSTVCRASTGECDPQETCSGSGPNCPSDTRAPEGQACGNNATAALTCASGQCTSRDLQCKTLMGSYSANNDTYACDSNSCQLSCASPEFGAGTCYGLQQNFLDGTACGGGGRCSNGRCQGSNSIKEIGSWIQRHRRLVIGIGSGLAAILGLLILCCIYSCIKRRKQPKRKRVPRNNYNPMPSNSRGAPQMQYHQAPPPAYMGPSVRYA